MTETEIIKKIISTALLKEINEIDENDMRRLAPYITLDTAKDNKTYYWYLDCDGIEVVSNTSGNIIEVEDTRDFFNI